jgi:hypothetical protein
MYKQFFLMNTAIILVPMLHPILNQIEVELIGLA